MGGGGGAYPRVVKTVNGEGGLSDGGAYLRKGLIGRILRYIITLILLFNISVFSFLNIL